VEEHEIFREALLQVAPTANLSLVQSGRELQGRLQHFVPDFIFLDLGMPGQDGLQCLRQIRLDPMMQHVHVVIFSGSAQPMKIAMAYEMGADLFIVKPDKFQKLVQTLEQIFALDWSHPTTVKEQYQRQGQYAPGRQAIRH
jgi:CheY-like chemotaxis protein